MFIKVIKGCLLSIGELRKAELARMSKGEKRPCAPEHDSCSLHLSPAFEVSFHVLELACCHRSDARYSKEFVLSCRVDIQWFGTCFFGKRQFRILHREVVMFCVDSLKFLAGIPVSPDEKIDVVQVLLPVVGRGIVVLHGRVRHWPEC